MHSTPVVVGGVVLSHLQEPFGLVEERLQPSAVRHASAPFEHVSSYPYRVR